MVSKTSKDLRKIHWNLRKKGYSMPQAYKKARQIKGLDWKFKKKHAYKDYDGDGKVNKYDCQPRNKWKQDAEDYGRGYSEGLKNDKYAGIDIGDDETTEKQIKDWYRGFQKGKKVFNKKLKERGGYYAHGGNTPIEKD